MMYSLIVIFHICAGTISLLSGAVALYARKGAHLHRISGNVFFVAMLCMSASGAYRAFLAPRMISVVVGVLTFYLVATAWLTVKRKAGTMGWLEFVALLVAIATGVAGLAFGFEASQSATGLKDGVPAGASFFFGSVALIAAALDVNMLIRGGVSGVHRIARHLWRMCFALLIATISLFIGQEQIFPEVIRKTHILGAPVLVVFVLLIYWLARVLFTDAFKNSKK